MKLQINEVASELLNSAKRLGLSNTEAQTVTQQCLEAELLGKTTHGIGKYCYESQFFADRLGKIKTLMDTGPIVKIDGQKQIGAVAAKESVEISTDRAKKFGIGIVAIHNIQRYGMLRTWSELFISKKMFGVVMNSCPPAMSVYGINRKLFGTNPIAFSIPTKDSIVTVDMSTSKVAMSLIWDAITKKESLPEKSFFDENGEYTTNPHEAKAVENFGDFKGANIALLVEILTGSLFGFKMGEQAKDMYDIGYLFIAIDPEKFSSYAEYLENNTALINSLQKYGATLPGETSNKKKIMQTKSGFIHLDETVWNSLKNIGRNYAN